DRARRGLDETDMALRLRLVSVAVCCEDREARRWAEAAARRRASGAVTVTDGMFCAPLCAEDCANDACGINTQADAVANTADRSIPRLFNAPPQNCVFVASRRLSH